MATRSSERTGGFDGDWDAAAVGLAAAVAAAVAVSLWTSVVARATRPLIDGASSGPPWTLFLASAVTVLAGFGAGSVAYTRYWGYDLPIVPPRRGTRGTAAAAVLSSAALAVGAAVVGNLAFDVTLSAVMQRRFSPDAPVSFLLASVLPTAAAVGVGYGALFFGVVGERARQLLGPDRAVPATTALVGFYWLLPVGSLGQFRSNAGFAVEVGLSLVFGAAFGASVAFLYRAVDPSTTTFRPRDALVIAVATVGVVGVASGLTTVPGDLGDLLWLPVFGIAAVGYERTRSLWTPALVIAAFRVTVGVVVYAEAVLGLASI